TIKNIMLCDLARMLPFSLENNPQAADSICCNDPKTGVIIRGSPDQFLTQNVTPKMKGTRVLIVDDDPQFGFVVKNLLELEGVESELARTREEAFQKLTFSPFDVMLLDLVLGKDSGLEILRELKQSGSSIPIIMMTAHGSIDTVSEALRLNA